MIKNNTESYFSYLKAYTQITSDEFKKILRLPNKGLSLIVYSNDQSIIEFEDVNKNAIRFDVEKIDIVFSKKDTKVNICLQKSGVVITYNKMFTVCNVTFIPFVVKNIKDDKVLVRVYIAFDYRDVE